MARAIKVHEVTMTTNFVGVPENLTQTVSKAITSMEVSEDNEFRDAFFTLKSLLSAMNY